MIDRVRDWSDGTQPSRVLPGARKPAGEVGAAAPKRVRGLMRCWRGGGSLRAELMLRRARSCRPRRCQSCATDGLPRRALRDLSHHTHGDARRLDVCEALNAKAHGALRSRCRHLAVILARHQRLALRQQAVLIAAVLHITVARRRYVSSIPAAISVAPRRVITARQITYLAKQVHCAGAAAGMRKHACRPDAAIARCGLDQSALPAPLLPYSKSGWPNWCNCCCRTGGWRWRHSMARSCGCGCPVWNRGW